MSLIIHEGISSLKQELETSLPDISMGSDIFTFYKRKENHVHSHTIEEDRDTDEEIELEDMDYLLDPIRDAESWDKENKFPTSLLYPSHARKRIVKKVILFYNPFSGQQKGALITRKCEVLFCKADIKVEAIMLEKKGHAEDLCKNVSLSGIDIVCIVGGDGTFHECINGWMKRENEKERHSVPLAVIPGGTGNSFVLELQGTFQVKRSVQHIIRGIHCPIDIAKIECADKEIIYSFNSIHWGLASKVNVTAERLRWMGKAVRYTTAALLELMRGETTRAKITLEEGDGKIINYDEHFCCVIANNIASTMKGMKIVPHAKINDGLIDVLLIRSSNTLTLLNIFKKMYEGTHTEMEHVEYRQVKSFSITPYKTEEAGSEIEEIIDIDGELKGSTPFKCTVISQALRVIL